MTLAVSCMTEEYPEASPKGCDTASHAPVKFAAVLSSRAIGGTVIVDPDMAEFVEPQEELYEGDDGMHCCVVLRIAGGFIALSKGEAATIGQKNDVSFRMICEHVAHDLVVESVKVKN